jgi:hypothetical protein
MSAVYSLRKIYGSATILAAITLTGLIFGLFGEGIWDAVSWSALSVPLFVIAWKIARSIWALSGS